MTEEKNNSESSCCSFCKGGKMMCGTNGTHGWCHIVRWVLAILILWAVFMGGVKIGELKGTIDKDGFRGSRHMYGSQMMRGGYGMKNIQSGRCAIFDKNNINSGNFEKIIQQKRIAIPEEQLLQ